jgi:hypothetical protein
VVPSSSSELFSSSGKGIPQDSLMEKDSAQRQGKTVCDTGTRPVKCLFF